MLFLMALLTFSAWAQIEQCSSEAEKVKLEYQLIPGQTLKYRISAQGSGELAIMDQAQPMTISFSGFEVRKCNQVRPDGSFDLVITMDSPLLKTKVGGQQQTISPQLPPISLRMNQQGQMHALQGWEHLSVAGIPPGINLTDLMIQLGQICLPDSELGVGDSWGQARKIAVPNAPPVEVRVASTLMGWEQISGIQCAKISTQVSAPVYIQIPPNALGMSTSITGEIKLEASTHFAPELGFEVRQQATLRLNLATQITMQVEEETQVISGNVDLKIDYSEQWERQ